MKDVLLLQQAYMRYKLKRPVNKTVREFVYACTTLNDQLAKLPPLFDTSQKLPDSEFLYAVHANADKPYRDIVKYQGFDLSTSSTKDYIEMCKRALVNDYSSLGSENYARRHISRKDR